MAYRVKEIFYTLQGEGARTGRPAVFLRFSGCNLWSGVEAERESALCRFCDTDFSGTDGENGGDYDSAEALSQVVESLWPDRGHGKPYVVCTGGEPMLQLDTMLVEELHRRRFEVAIETNGTLPVCGGVDWITVSPKARTRWVQKRGNELKLVWPQQGMDPDDIELRGFSYFFLQPADGPQQAENIRLCTAFCLKNPAWRLSLQMHKVAGIR